MKRALVLVNIGTPNSLTVSDVRKYLRKFLMDPFVIDIPYLIRLLLVQGVIVPFRAKKSLEAYSKIWKKEGSPLKIYTEQLVHSIKSEKFDKVDYAMSYSDPMIDGKLTELKKEGFQEIYYLPMYPQYAESSSRSALEAARKWKRKEENRHVKIKSINYFFDNEDFIDAAAAKIKSQIHEVSEESFFLFSFHGLPERHVKKLYPKHCKNSKSCCEKWGVHNELCYRAQCHQTAKIISGKIGFKNWGYSFQSRLGRDQWLLPYTVEKVKDLAISGVNSLVVIPYAFTIDCLETEEEVENEIKDIFTEHGGQNFYRVECLNNDFSKVLTNSFVDNFTELEVR